MSEELFSPLVAFFVQRGIGPRGLTWTDIVEGQTDEELERSHDEIQWLFPLNEASAHIVNAPIITAEDLEVLEKPFARAHLIGGVMRFMHFYGMKYAIDSATKSFVVEPGDNFAERAEVWATPNNHNLKRITRIIRSARFFKADSVAKGVYDAFVALQPFMPDVITETVRGYWDNALNIPLDQHINVTLKARQGSC